MPHWAKSTRGHGDKCYISLSTFASSNVSSASPVNSTTYHHPAPVILISPLSSLLSFILALLVPSEPMLPMQMSHVSNANTLTPARLILIDNLGDSFLVCELLMGKRGWSRVGGLESGPAYLVISHFTGSRHPSDVSREVYDPFISGHRTGF